MQILEHRQLSLARTEREPSSLDSWLRIESYFLARRAAEPKQAITSTDSVSMIAVTSWVAVASWVAATSWVATAS